VSDDAVREVGIETVLQEGAGAFMLYYERVVGEDGPDRSWTGAGLHAWEAGAGGGTGGGEGEGDGSEEEKAQRTHTEDPDQHALGEEQESVATAAPLAAPLPSAVIKARVVRSVSLGPDEILGGTSAKREEKEEEVVDTESRPSEPSLTVVAPEVEPPLAASVKAASPIPEPPVVDEPPISFHQTRTVDLRA
jgi:hypothetical protein